MKPSAAFLLVWMLTGAGAVAGSIPGNAAGKIGLFARGKPGRPGQIQRGTKLNDTT